MKRRDIERARLAREEAAKCPRLEYGRYYTVPQLGGVLGIDRNRLYDALESLTYERGEGYRAAHRVRADERLVALCERWFIRCQIGEHTTLARWPVV